MDEALQHQMELAERLLKETREHMKNGEVGGNLTCSLQLKNDCDGMERLLKSLKKGKITDKSLKELTNAYIRMKTTSENIMGWRFME